MTLDQFYAYNKGKKVDYDKSFGYQCCDLVELYNHDVLGRGQISGNAERMYDMSIMGGLRGAINTPEYIPPRGAIACYSKQWGCTMNHVAIVLAADIQTLTLFEQNNPIGSPCVLKTVTYDPKMRFIIPPAEYVTDEVRYRDLIKRTNAMIEEVEIAIKRIRDFLATL